MNAATKWILAIVGLLAANLIAMIVLASVAHSGGAQVIPDYYETAARYDETLDERARSKALGWTAAATLHGAVVDVEVRDAAGGALDGARVTVTGYPRAHAAARFELELSPVGDGGYRGALSAHRGGVHDVTVIVERAGERFTRALVVEAR